jgi:hypothetical protein
MNEPIIEVLAERIVALTERVERGFTDLRVLLDDRHKEVEKLQTKVEVLQIELSSVKTRVVIISAVLSSVGTALVHFAFGH